MAFKRSWKTRLQVGCQLPYHDDDRWFAVLVADAEPGNARDGHEPIVMAVEYLLNVHGQNLLDLPRRLHPSLIAVLDHNVHSKGRHHGADRVAKGHVVGGVAREQQAHRLVLRERGDQ